MSKRMLFYKAIIWQIVGIIWITLFSYLWFGNWNKSFLFSFIVMIVSIFIYVIYEILWQKLINYYNKK
jgi:hypothetical protein